MVCLGLEPGATEWKVQTNSLSGTPIKLLVFVTIFLDVDDLT